MLPGTEIAAHATAPDRESGSLARPIRRARRSILSTLAFRRAALWDGFHLSLPLQDLVRDIEGTVACPILP
jgi:hypothetical protein